MDREVRAVQLDVVNLNGEHVHGGGRADQRKERIKVEDLGGPRCFVAAVGQPVERGRRPRAVHRLAAGNLAPFR